MTMTLYPQIRMYHIPKSKKELMTWLERRFPYAASDFKKMEKSQLYAIFYKAVNKHEEAVK